MKLQMFTFNVFSQLKSDMLEPAGWMKTLAPFENWGYNKYSCDQLYNIEKDSWLRKVHLLGLLSISVNIRKDYKNLSARVFNR